MVANFTLLIIIHSLELFTSELVDGFLLLLLLYNSSILDIEQSPYHIAHGSTQIHKVI